MANADLKSLFTSEDEYTVLELLNVLIDEVGKSMVKTAKISQDVDDSLLTLTITLSDDSVVSSATNLNSLTDDEKETIKGLVNKIYDDGTGILVIEGDGLNIDCNTYFFGDVSFDNAPTCNSEATNDNELITKKYSDDLWSTRKAQEEKCYQALKTVTKDFTLTNAVFVNVDPETGLPLIRYFADENESMNNRFADLPECVFHLYLKTSSEMNRTFYGSSVRKVYIHGSCFNSTWYCFSGCANLTHVGELDTDDVISFGGTFNGCKNLQAVPKMKMSGTASNNYAFNGATSVTSFDGYDIIGNFDLSSMKLLSHDELVKIIGNLQSLSEQGKYTLTLGSTLLAKLTDDEKAVATDEKGWVLA